ncbi:glycoside hydrolase, partial [Fomitiporia mediterranea MF3/22]|uniref:glycoside hydrolase n=1 Tax=Fomitiporia mediterranea (strain MF3/22) TaxID=694068 RepID=UPI0004407BE9
FVIYSDKWVTNALPDVSKLEGYNVFALSFLLSTGAADQAMAWQQLDDNTRKSLKSKYESAGIKVIVSAFGATETPTTAGADATKVANDMANWVKKYNVDGIDVDYEDLGAMNAGDGKAEEWLATFTKTLRGQLPQGKYIITHAPLPPWFNSESYKGGGYQKVNKEVGNMIDWYNVQFYNQNDYTDCDSLLTKSKTKTSLFEIAGTGVDKNKLLIGKPATAADASNGFMDTKTLAGCVKQAKDKGWNAGVMVWQYPNADSQWIKDVRGDAFPVGK